MALFNWKLASNPLDLITGGGELPVIKRPVIQVGRSKENNLQAWRTLNVSRRDILLYLTAAAVGGFTILSTEKTAEARVGRLENKKRAMEKLQKLREKAGVSNSKTPLAQSRSEFSTTAS